MRLIKAQNTNLRNIYGKGVKYDVNDQVILDSTNTVLVPSGTTAQRPTSPVNGHMRYNTTDARFEIYENMFSRPSDTIVLYVLLFCLKLRLRLLK